MKRHFAILSIAATAALWLTACAGGEESAEQASAEGSASSATSDSTASQTSATDEVAAVEILDTGVGQDDAGVQGIVIVTTDDESAVGEVVTVTGNLLGADGGIITTVEQIESFSWAGQELAIPFWVHLDDPSAEVANIDVSASLSNYGSQPVMDPLPVLNAREVKANESGGFSTAFEFTNESGADIEHLRVGVVCYDASNKIIGGTSTYPSLAPAGKAIQIEADPIVSADPASCKAFLGHEMTF